MPRRRQFSGDHCKPRITHGTIRKVTDVSRQANLHYSCTKLLQYGTYRRPYRKRSKESVRNVRALKGHFSCGMKSWGTGKFKV